MNTETTTKVIQTLNNKVTKQEIKIQTRKIK